MKASCTGTVIGCTDLQMIISLLTFCVHRTVALIEHAVAYFNLSKDISLKDLS